MSWHFSQALVTGFSEATCLDGAPSAPSNLNPTQRLYSSSDRMMEFCPRSPSGMTCEPLTESLGADVLTWFLGAFPVRTLALLEKERDSTENDLVFGRKWRGSFARYDQGTSSWRTPQCSLLEGLDAYSEIWPKWGLMRNGECWALTKLVPLMSANECGSLDSTPTKVMPVETNLTPDRIKILPSGRVRKISKNGTDGSMNWAQLMLHKGFLPAPMLCEHYMGWPIGMTDLQPLETDKFQEWRQQHSACLPPTTMNHANDNDPSVNDRDREAE